MTSLPPEVTPDTVELPAEAPRSPRRVPWAPIFAAAAAVLAVLLVIAIVMLLANPRQPAPVASSSPSASAPAPAPVETSPAPVEPAPAPRPEAGPNECVDELGDAGAVDLDTASIAVDDGDIVTRVTLASALPKGEAALGAVVQSKSGQRSYQLGVGVTDGEIDQVFVLNLSTGDRDDLDDDSARVTGDTITASFPDDILKRLGNDWTWYAFGTAAGTDLDACPGTAQEPGSLTFDPRAR